MKIDGVTLSDGQAMKQINRDRYRDRYFGILELDRVKKGR